MEAGRQPGGGVVGWGGEAEVDFGVPREGQQDSPCGWLEFGKRKGAGSRLDGALEHPEKHAVS